MPPWLRQPLHLTEVPSHPLWPMLSSVGVLEPQIHELTPFVVVEAVVQPASLVEGHYSPCDTVALSQLPLSSSEIDVTQLAVFIATLQSADCSLSWPVVDRIHYEASRSGLGAVWRRVGRQNTRGLNLAPVLSPALRAKKPQHKEQKGQQWDCPSVVFD